MPEALEPEHASLPYAAPPFVVFYIHAGAEARDVNPGHPPCQLNLADGLDLAALGDGPLDVSRTQTGLRIISSFESDQPARQRMVSDSLNDLAFGWGFLAADVNGLMAQRSEPSTVPEV